ncbi:type IV pilus modification protein PilV [Teredinibacter waterburyi]|uniref:type IV pilus modification protein PilV n=1 Tax=Teredinibacter waterburyi TaxID=1500538 RepID=UPI00165FA6F1|nr:type IV pilus modification protein PilV [Teredinibacter waterburyi]
MPINQPLAGFVSHSSSASLKAQAGFSMVEVIIAFLILAVGLLGVASMQKRGVESNQAAYLRSQAISMAQDFTGRIRANTEAYEANNYNDPTPKYTGSCLTTGCTATALAQHDYFEWKALLASVLPAGVGVVCIDSTPDDGDDDTSPACDGSGNELAIKIWWDAKPRDGVIDQFYVIGMEL